MTRKDYVAIAEVISSNRSVMNEVARAGVDVVATELATVLKRNNPRFDRDRFLTACGVI